MESLIEKDIHVMRTLIIILGTVTINSSLIYAQSDLAEEKFELYGIKEVEVRGSFCDVTVKGYTGQTLYFDGKISGSSGKNYSIEYDRDGSFLKIWVESPHNNWGFTRGQLNLRVPDGIEVVVDNSSGDVYASDLTGRNIRLEASSGDIEANDIGNDLLLETSSGDIELTGLNGNLRSKSSSGDQRLRKVKGDIDGRSSSGRISLDDIVGDIVAETSSGGIELDGFKGGLKLESTSGSLNGDEIELTTNSSFRSSSGSIDMELVNEIESLNFDLDASSGSLRIGGRRAEDRYIDRQGGDIEIKGVSSSGSQRYSN